MKKILLFLLLANFLSVYLIADAWRMIRPDVYGDYSVLTAGDLDQMTRLQLVQSLRSEIRIKKNNVLIQQLLQSGFGLLAAVFAGACGHAIFMCFKCRPRFKLNCMVSAVVSGVLAQLFIIPVIEAQNEKTRIHNELEPLEERLKSMEYDLSK